MMAATSSLLALSHSILSTLVSVLIGFTIAYLIKFYYSDRKKYPPGPTPIPLLGNLLLFKNKENKLPHDVILDLRHKYGPVFTFWMGSFFPQIVVADGKLAKEALNSFHFAGRPVFEELNHLFFGDDSVDLVLADWGREWEILRKISHSAVRKFAVSEKLPPMIDTTVKRFLKSIQQQHGDDFFDPDPHFSHLMMSLLATIVYGKHFEMDDPDFVKLYESFKMQLQVNTRVSLFAVVPSLKYIWRKEYNIMMASTSTQRTYAAQQLSQHEASYVDGEVRDFTDALIFAVKEAEAEGSQDLVHLKKRNVQNVMMDIFGAGSETTRLTLLWIMLHMAAYPEYQRAVRKEVEAVLSLDEIATLDHRPKCNLLQAFISEVMRIRPIIPLNVPHKAIVDTELAGHKIKKGTVMMIPLEAAAKDESIWGDPHTFRPERFLDANNQYVSRPNPYFIPFSAGRRACLGEKLALANSFLIMMSILNQTRGKMIQVAGDTVDLSPSACTGLNLLPNNFEMTFA